MWATWFPRPQTCPEPLPESSLSCPGWMRAGTKHCQSPDSVSGDIESKFPCHLRWKQRCPIGTAQPPRGSVTVSLHLETSQKKSSQCGELLLGKFLGKFTTSQHPSAKPGPSALQLFAVPMQRMTQACGALSYVQK